MRSGCAIWLCDLVVRSGCAIWLCDLVVRSGCAIWLCDLAGNAADEGDTESVNKNMHRNHNPHLNANPESNTDQNFGQLPSGQCWSSGYNARTPH